jgi:hypothetical protein
MKNLASVTILVAVIMSGCTSVYVNPVPEGHTIKSVSILDNPKVMIPDFTEVLIDGFERKGIKARVVRSETGAKDEYLVTYVAYRKWDLVPYLCDATIRIDKGDKVIGTAVFHLENGGGLTFSKYYGTKTKIDPVIDELLKNL